jgi:DNA polymerase I
MFAGLDVETTAIGSAAPFRIRTVQLASDQGVKYLIAGEDDGKIIEALSDTNNQFVSHTAYDAVALYRYYGIDISDRTIDTRVLGVMAAPDDKAGQAGLKELASTHLDDTLLAAETDLYAEFLRLYRLAHPNAKKAVKKAEVKSWGFDNCPTDNPIYKKYAMLDAETVLKLFPILLSKIKSPEHLIEQEIWLAQQAIKIQQKGLSLDFDKVRKLHDKVERESQLIEQEFSTITGLTPRQPAAVMEWFTADGVDLTAFPRTPKGAYATGGSNRKLLLGLELTERARNAAELWIDYSGYVDRVRRVKEIVACTWDTAIIHPTLQTLGTVTGRMSASSPNIQNYNKKDSTLRNLYVARPGHKLISCDFSQVELRVLAALAGEDKMIDAIANGDDLHQLTADLLGVDRQVGKTVNFLIVYGGGGSKLAQSIDMPVDFCKQVVSNYWRQYPKIAALRSSTMGMDGITTISGRAVPTATLPDGSSKAYANLNYLVQGSARELLVGAWRRYASVPEWADTVWFPVHDELILEVPDNMVDLALERIGECMSCDFYGVPIVADAHVMEDGLKQSRWTCE